MISTAGCSASSAHKWAIRRTRARSSGVEAAAARSRHSAARRRHSNARLWSLDSETGTPPCGRERWRLSVDGGPKTVPVMGLRWVVGATLRALMPLRVATNMTLFDSVGTSRSTGLVPDRLVARQDLTAKETRLCDLSER